LTRTELAAKEQLMTELRKGRVLWKGTPTDLVGPELKPGDKAPSDFTLSGNDLSAVSAKDLAGKPRIFVAVPSLDTAVCDTEVRKFNVEAAKIPGLSVYAVSLDLPFAQKRWCGSAGIENVRTLSDFKFQSFGRAFGVLAPEKGLFARAVIVVGKDDVIKHVEFVPEVTTEPNYAAALDAARALV
jgi:thiol peroxidase